MVALSKRTSSLENGVENASSRSHKGRRRPARGLAVQTSWGENSTSEDHQKESVSQIRNLNLIPMTPQMSPPLPAPHKESFSGETQRESDGGPDRQQQQQQQRDVDVGPRSSHSERAEWLMSADDPADLASNSNESSRMSMRRLGSFKNQDTLQRVSIVSSHSSERIFKPGGTTASVISLGHWNGQRWRQRNLERAEERTWWNKVFGARKREGGAAAETNQQIPYIKAIHPESPFRFFWILITTIILLYTLFWTPFSVAFYWSLDACQTLPTLKFDVFVDVWFAVDLILNFVTGTMNLTDLGYEDRLSVVAPKYITSGSFFFDLITTTPVGLIEFILMLECDPNEAAGYSALYGRFTRIVKPVRLFKLVRLVKIIRSKSILSDMSAIKTEPPPAIILSRLFIKIFAAVHIGACMFWLTKVASNSDLDVEEFLHAQGLDNASVGERYVTSIYFVSAVVTTVGFGDVVGSNTWERLYCVLIMFIGSVIFGTLLANISDIAMMLDDSATERSMMSELIGWARRKKVPSELLEHMACWVNFELRKTKESEDEQRHLQKLIHAPALYKSVVEHLHGGLLHCVPYFGGIRHELRELLILELWQVMDLYLFCKDTVMISTEEPCDKLYIITEGYAKAVGGDGTVIGEIFSGSHVGERCVLGDPDVGLEFGSDEVYVIASENLSCLVIDRATLEGVLANYPEELISEVRSLAADSLRRLPPRRNKLILPDTVHPAACISPSLPRGGEPHPEGLESRASPRMRMVMKPTRIVLGSQDVDEIISPRVSRTASGGACTVCSQLADQVKQMASSMADITDQLGRIEWAVNAQRGSAAGVDDVEIQVHA